MTLRDAAQQALEALTAHVDLHGTMYLRMDAITALRAALAEPQPEIEQLKAERDALQNTKHYEAPRGFVLNPDYLVPELQAERDALQKRLALAEAVASAASGLSVAHNAEGDDWDEWLALEAALKPWRAQRAIDTIKIKAPVIQLDEAWLSDDVIRTAREEKP